MEKKGVIKIGVVGPESTGKSVLCELLAKHYETVYVPEFARTYFEYNKIEKHRLFDIDFVYRMQIDLENRMLEKANVYLFCDTTLVSGKVWAEEVFNTTPPFVADNLNKIKYDMLLLCDIDLPWVKDKQRRNEHNRSKLFDDHKRELDKMNVPYKIIRGLKEVRLHNAIKAIEES